MTTLRAFAAVVALGFLLSSCGSADEVTATSADATSSDAAASESVAGVFDTVSGSQLDIGSIEGQDTVLWFWAPW